MADRFEQFRLSLLARPHRDLFAGPDKTREEYLRAVFSEGHVFDHYRTRFHYAPSKGEPGAEALLGRIGREVEMQENLSPAEGLEDTVHLTWKAAVVVLDPRDHTDGQRIAVEINRAVGSAHALLSALVDSINAANPRAPYSIEAQPIFEANSFWMWAEENAGEVIAVTFDLVAPNGLFNAANNVRNELREVKASTGANEIKIGLRNRDGLDTESEAIVETVEYAVAAGGRITGKAKSGSRFSSTSQASVTKVENDEEDNQPLIVRAARKISAIFGRE